MMILQHRQIFHHEKAHPEKPHTMNFRCNVTMATLPGQNNNKDSFQPNRKNFFISAIQMTPNYSKMIANINCFKLLPANNVKPIWERLYLPRKVIER